MCLAVSNDWSYCPEGSNSWLDNTDETKFHIPIWFRKGGNQAFCYFVAYMERLDDVIWKRVPKLPFCKTQNI